MAFIYTLLNYAFPGHVLKLVFKREFALDTMHNLFCRQFGIWALFAGVVSVAAPNFTVKHQKDYVASRVMTQGFFFLLNVYGHWGSETIYSHNHISPFMISGFYITFLLSVFYKLKRTADSETSQGEVPEEHEVLTEDEEEKGKPKSS
uniref:Elongation of very long chain fatty acids protein n=1 Tax=Steinernema glaseri TaxID=37863 RepID=A0A1I7YEC0_9BILA